MTAVRFTAASSESVRITSSPLNYNADYTVAGWVYIVAAVGTLFNLRGSDTSGNSDNIYIFDDSGTYRIRGEFLTTFTGPTIQTSGLSLNTWYHVAIRRSGTTCSIWINGSSAASDTHDPSGRAAVATMQMGNNDWGDAGSFRAWGWNAWDNDLSDGDVAAEDANEWWEPVQTTNLWGTWHFDGEEGTRSEDQFGAHDWTELNTPTDEADPGFTDPGGGGGGAARYLVDGSLAGQSPLFGGLVR